MNYQRAGIIQSDFGTSLICMICLQGISLPLFTSSGIISCHCRVASMDSSNGREFPTIQAVCCTPEGRDLQATGISFQALKSPYLVDFTFHFFLNVDLPILHQKRSGKSPSKMEVDQRGNHGTKTEAGSVNQALPRLPLALELVAGS